ncbi:uncharacterized protein M6B38_308045 [Iris pallida]|uniref:Uncharacterized protein n=1 Tax=Iris pallida TaxID=29817 RepID=A0AAX6F6X7_IRIPA|nr:uncharacterized protein M6B38_150675 [Iris pallida]KAJ6841183.1 uncharacterized protein M6B38_308045 [Iris pallida]
MPCCYSSSSSFSPCCSGLRSWLHDYDSVQSFAVVLIYIQIGCALVGSLGALFNGVLMINLVVSLFAIVAIESSSQSLSRTYAALLFCAILLDVAWFILFSHAIWNFAPENYGPFFAFSLRLALVMQIIGFSVRFFSSFLWVQMYRLGVSSVNSSAYQEPDFDVRSSFLNPSTCEIPRHNFNGNEFLGGSIYDTTYYSSLFEDAQDKRYTNEGDKQVLGYDRSSISSNESPQLRSCISRSFQVIDVDNIVRKH